VESEQIRSALADFGCAEAQGWLFGRPISAEAVRSFLAMGSSDAGKAPDKTSDPDPRRSSANRRW
jgi:predicted signal transduction protein with EAL and GGDEF domain